MQHRASEGLYIPGIGLKIAVFPHRGGSAVSEVQIGPAGVFGLRDSLGSEKMPPGRPGSRI